jgi:hypothetical protein
MGHLTIISSGLGFLVIVFAFGFSLIAQLLTNAIIGNGDYWAQHKSPFGLSLLVSATVCWFFGKYLATRKARTLIDKETGKEIIERKKHTFFFIEMQWWGPILGVIGMVLIILDATKFG